MNVCIFVGRLVADAKIETTPNGKTVCKFRLASDTGWGDYKETHWLNCSLWGERGSKIVGYLTKGLPVTVSGTLKPARTYQDRGGETRTAQDLDVQEIALQGGKSDSGASGGSDYQDRAPAAQNGTQRASGAHGVYVAGRQDAPVDDDIPF